MTVVKRALGQRCEISYLNIWQRIRSVWMET